MGGVGDRIVKNPIQFGMGSYLKMCLDVPLIASAWFEYFDRTNGSIHAMIF